MSEEWIRWEPVPGLVDKYYVKSISDTFTELRVVLCSFNDDKQQVTLSWENSVYAYRTTYESFRQKIVYELDKKYGSDFYNWTFFKVKNSSYLQWLSEESYTISDSISFTHYALVATESILDIVSGFDPKVEITQLP
jgi:hypothetical protein